MHSFQNIIAILTFSLPPLDENNAQIKHQERNAVEYEYV